MNFPNKDFLMVDNGTIMVILMGLYICIYIYIYILGLIGIIMVYNMGISINGRYPKWMLYKVKSIKINDDCGYPNLWKPGFDVGER